MKTVDEFMTRVRVQPDGCWKWTFPVQRSRHGLYGCCHWLGVGMGAHRASWLIFRGPIPEGLEIDHLCRNTRCCNPDHLEPVTHRENVLRGVGLAAVNARKTHCIRGHEFTPENTIRNGRKRACRTCVNEAQRVNRLKRLGVFSREVVVTRQVQAQLAGQIGQRGDDDALDQPRAREGRS